ncbi:MAG: CopG family antitoxin [Caulobacteraceae bacterium]
MKRAVPELSTDAEAEAFLDQDLADLDFRRFKPVRFEFEKKAARGLREKGR